jgi:hypothetical protein
MVVFYNPSLSISTSAQSLLSASIVFASFRWYCRGCEGKRTKTSAAIFLNIERGSCCSQDEKARAQTDAEPNVCAFLVLVLVLVLIGMITRGRCGRFS